MATTKSKTTTDHARIQRWAEARDAHPAKVRGTGRGDDPGMIRLDFPGYSGADKLEEITWDDWFQSFDDNDLALVYQDRTASGKQSNFNKLVGRETARARSRGNTRASRHGRRTRKSTSRSGKANSRRGTTRSTSSRGTGGRSDSRGSSRSKSSRSKSSRSRSSSRSGSSRSGSRSHSVQSRSSRGRSGSHGKR